MNLLAPISSIMTRNLITISENDPLSKVDEIFNENHIHHIPVVDKGKLIGMVSRTDFMFFKRGFNNNDMDKRLDLLRLKTHNAGEIMTKGLAFMESDQKINVALEVFKENLFHAIPIKEDGKLVGIVTTLDIIRNLAQDKEAINKYINT
jgi:acetoin utilization protein AcuB